MERTATKHEFTVLEALVPALMYGDESGLTDEDISALRDFEYTVQGWLIRSNARRGHFSFHTDRYNEFGYCEVTGLWGRTVEAEYATLKR